MVRKKVTAVRLRPFLFFYGVARQAPFVNIMLLKTKAAGGGIRSKKLLLAPNE